MSAVQGAQRAFERSEFEDRLDRLRRAMGGHSVDHAGRIDAGIERLLAKEVQVPAPTEAECRRRYETHPKDFQSTQAFNTTNSMGLRRRRLLRGQICRARFSTR